MTEVAELYPAAVIGLLVLGLCGLDVILRPLPVLAPRAQRRRRYGMWAVVVALYLAALVAL